MFQAPPHGLSDSGNDVITYGPRGLRNCDDVRPHPRTGEMTGIGSTRREGMTEIGVPG